MKRSYFHGMICQIRSGLLAYLNHLNVRSYLSWFPYIPTCIQDDTKEARRKWDLVHLVSLLKPKVKRKRRRHTLTYVEKHSDAADKFLHHKN
jgi:hypothetical protein